MAHQSLTVLLIAAPAMQAQLQRVLDDAGSRTYQLVAAADGAAGLRCWHAQPPDCVLLDERLADLPALEVLAALVQATDGNAPVVLLTSTADPAAAQQALQQGAQGYLFRDRLTGFELEWAIANAVEKVRLRQAQRPARDPARLARYQQLIAHMRDIVLFVRADGQLVEANDAAVAAYGYDRAALLGKTIADLRDPATAALVASQLAQADHEGLRFETMHRRRDGTTFPVEVSAIGADIGGERLLLSVIRDISVRSQEAQTLREREQFISAVLHTTPNLIYVHDMIKGKTVYLNNQIEPLFGYTLAELEALGGTIFLQLVHPDDLPSLQAHLERLRYAGDDAVRDHAFRFRHRDGSWHWLECHDRVFDRDPAGAVRLVLGVASNSSARKQAEAALRTSEQRARAIWEAASDAMVLSDEAGIVLDANQAYCDLYGYSPEQVLGQSFAIIFPPDQRAWAITQYLEIVRTRVALPTYESTIRRALGDIAGGRVARDLCDRRRWDGRAALDHPRYHRAHAAGRAAAPQRGAVQDAG
jgi:PAS domain S-box-containing protein